MRRKARQGNTKTTCVVNKAWTNKATDLSVVKRRANRQGVIYEPSDRDFVCIMCPLYPFHVILLYVCLLLPLLLAVVECSDILDDFKRWNLVFRPQKVDGLLEKKSTEVELTCYRCILPPSTANHHPMQFHLSLRAESSIISLQCEDHFEPAEKIEFSLERFNGLSEWTQVFNISGTFLGITKVVADIRNDKEVFLSKTLPVSVIREKTLESRIFAVSVAVLISLAYVNMGCALDLEIIKKVLKRPVGPWIGFVCQFVLMPLISYCLGFIFPSTEAAMRLGLFVTGVSPGGGASNIWTLMLGGNLNLSITMTTVSTFAAFFMMPLWIFSLGKLVFHDANIEIPYANICAYGLCLVVPLGIGILISRYLPRVAQVLLRILKPLALFLILFILIFGIWANLYIFKLMTWRVLLSGMALPWLGFTFGFLTARSLGRNLEDVIAIAVETGVQNTGVSIVILWNTLHHPVGDLAAAVPIAAAMMTPIPLCMALVGMKIRVCYHKKYSLGYNIPGDQDDASEIKSKQAAKGVNGDFPVSLEP